MADCGCRRLRQEYQNDITRRKTSSFECICPKDCKCICEFCICGGELHYIDMPSKSKLDQN